jgi:hypothetical protein
MGEQHDHGARTMHAGRCRTDEEVLGLCILSDGLSQEQHSDAIGCRQDSVRGLAWEEAIFEASPCVLMLGFCPRSKRETKQAGLQSHSRHIRWVRHID